ncbi:MAG: hypothetical protein ACJ75Z_07585 [Solirubrobacterales bacterium]
MRKLLGRRPSAGTVIAFIALCVALGGGAYAATKKKTEYKGLSKDARLKVLPVSATNAGTNCDPTSATDYKTCTSVSLKTSSAFKRRVALTFNGVFNSATPPGTAARGECRLQVDGVPLGGTQIRVEPGIHTDPASPVNSSDKDYGDAYGINIVTVPQGGEHTYSVACNQFGSGDLRVQQFQLSAETVR